MRVFVTGGAGFIGSNLVDRLLSNDHTVVAFDNLSTGHERFLERASASSRFRLVKGDTLDPEALRRAMADLDVRRLEACRRRRDSGVLRGLRIPGLHLPLRVDSRRALFARPRLRFLSKPSRESGCPPGPRKRTPAEVVLVRARLHRCHAD